MKDQQQPEGDGGAAYRPTVMTDEPRFVTDFSVGPDGVGPVTSLDPEDFFPGADPPASPSSDKDGSKR